jgi:hypothetical protein
VLILFKRKEFRTQKKAMYSPGLCPVLTIGMGWEFVFN